MRKILTATICLSFISSFALADIFGTEANQFTIDFVTISGDASIADGTNISQFSPGEDGYMTFTDPGIYRIGIYEITNEQWDKFKNNYGTVTGNPNYAYDLDRQWEGSNIPFNGSSWYEAAQFVNWLNTSEGYQAAYKFTGTQGTTDYTFVPWEVTDDGYDAANPFRNSNAYYFLPTENEWVKAAYWNGITLQTFATIDDSIPIADLDTKYDGAESPWNVGSGSEELNGTYDMMGNLWEWMESPSDGGDYTSNFTACLRGGSYDINGYDDALDSASRNGGVHPWDENCNLGFRVASVPEPATILLLSLGGILIRRRKI